MTFNFEVGDGAHALDPQHLLDYTRGWQVIDAAGGSNLVDDNGTTDTVIRAAAGDINAGGDTVTCAQETVDLAADVDPDDPRKVTVYRTPAGALETAAGTPTAAQPSGATRRQAGEPAPPTLSGTDGVILASVWLAAGTASVTDADIRDRRLAAELPLEALTTDRAVFDDQSSAPSGVTGSRVLYAKASDGNFYKVNPNGSEEQIGGDAALSDSGTDTDGGNDYVLPQAADNIDLQSSGGLRNADVVSTDILTLGGKVFEQDGTIDTNNASSTTYSVSGSFDQLLVVTGPSGFGYDELQVNGDTGTNYDFVDTSDTKTTGASQWTIPRANQVEYYYLNATSGTVSFGISALLGADTGEAVRGVNTAITADITQLTFTDSGGVGRDIFAQVYGRAV